MTVPMTHHEVCGCQSKVEIGERVVTQRGRVGIVKGFSDNLLRARVLFRPAGKHAYEQFHDLDNLTWVDAQPPLHGLEPQPPDDQMELDLG